MNELISIIVPVYNAEKDLNRCVASIVQQTYRHLQIILVDDGSSDSSSLFIDQWATKDSRILALHQKNKGVSSARNTGLNYVQGKWVAFVDADDYLIPDYFEQMLKAAEQAKVDVLISDGCYREDVLRNGEIRKLATDEIETLKLACIAYDENIFNFNIDAPWGKLFKNEVIIKNKISFPEKLVRSEDALFCATYYEYTSAIGHYAWAGYIHTENANSLCRAYSPNAEKILLAILNELKEWVNIFHPNNEQYRQALYYRILPGINECEQVWLLHPNNPMSKIQIIRRYTSLLSVPLIATAIKNLDSSGVSFRPYQKRLKFYRAHMSWAFITAKLFKKK